MERKPEPKELPTVKKELSKGTSWEVVRRANESNMSVQQWVDKAIRFALDNMK